MSIREQFPHYDTASLPDLPDGWTDCSFRNDAAPSWNTGTGFVVLIDHADPEQRDFEVPRFCVVNEQDPDIAVLTDDWNVVLVMTGHATP